MPETLTAAEFEQRVIRLSERLDALRGTPRHASIGSTLPYAGLDLTAELPDLVPILAALIAQDPEEPITNNARLEVGGRRLALAVIMSLLQGGEGLADFSTRYQALMGSEPEYALYERVLPAAMREAGLPLPAKHDAKRLLESLLAAGGLPSSLVTAAAEYFTIYWRLFHPQNEVMAPLLAIQDAPKDWNGLDAATRTQLAALAKRLLPNAAVVGPSIEGLASVMTFLRTQHRWRVGDLLSSSDDIRGASGLDPAALLHNNADAMALLEGALGHAWHPEQFRHVLMSFPRGGEVRLPNGSLAMVDKTIAIPQWGVYQVERKTYLVLPNEGLTLDDVKAFPESGIQALGNRVIWRGAAEVEVSGDGWPLPSSPRALYDEKQPLGWLYYQIPPAARTMKIGNATLPPQPGVHWHTPLWASIAADGQPQLNVRVASLRVCLPTLAGTSVQLESPQAATAGRLTFDLDDRGVGGLPDRVLTLVEPAMSGFELFLQDHGTGEVVQFDGRPASTRQTLPEVMVFCESTGALVDPSALMYPFGLPSYLIFAARPINTSALQMQEIGVDTLGKVGDYEVHRVTWRDASHELSIHIDARHQWHFNHRVESVWQAGDLPKPEAPLAFVPETPLGYTVSNADNVYLDDVSMVHDPLVEIGREGETLAVHTWHELNWMMNFPEDNRRFSGLMLRRALHVGPEFDLAGLYTLGLKAGGEILGERQITILPTFQLAVTPRGAQDEDAVYSISATSANPVFAGGEKSKKIVLGSAVIDRDTMENSPFQPRALETTVTLQYPLVDLRLAVEPDVLGYRLLDDNEGTWIRKTHLTFEELSHITLVLFAAQAEKGTLTVGDGEALTEDFYEGFATFSLASLQDTLTEHETEVRVAVEGREVGVLTVVWHPKVSHFETANEYLQENVAHLELQARGPQSIPLRLEATAPDGRKLGTMEVETDGNAVKQVAFPLPAGRDYPVISIKVYVPTEQSGIASGSLEIRNASFEPEIEALNQRISVENRSADLRYERAQLLLARGLRKAAARDFQAAIELGMTELLDSPQYLQFLSQRRAESFHEDIKALASFFVPFARKELTIG